MRAGSFSLKFKDSARDEVIAEMRKALGYTGDGDNWSNVDGWILVLPGQIPPSMVQASMAIYTGRLLEQTDRQTFAGAGMAWCFGADGYPANLRTANATQTSRTFSQLVATADGVGDGAVITAVTTGVSTATSSFVIPIGSSVAELLDHIGSIYGTEWRYAPENSAFGGLNSFTCGLPGEIFVDPPQVLLSTITGGSSLQGYGTSSGLRGMEARIRSPKINAKLVTAKVSVFGGGVGAAAYRGNSTVDYGTCHWGGANLLQTRVVDAPDVESDTAAANMATAVHNLFRNPRHSFDVDVDDAFARRWIAPGDSIYVESHDDGITDTDTIGSSEVILHGGQPRFPVKARVQAMSWNVPQGWGVYLWRKNTADNVDRLTDITEYLDMPDRHIHRLTVGTGNGRGDQSFTGGLGRLDDRGLIEQAG